MYSKIFYIACLIFVWLLPIGAQDPPIIWSLSYPGSASSVIETQDKTLIITGSELIKLTEAGKILWEKKMLCTDAQSVNNSGFIVIGYVDTIRNSGFIKKFNDADQIEWERPIRGCPYSVFITKDNGFITGGRYDTTIYKNCIHDQQIHISKLDPTGKTEWEIHAGVDTSNGGMSPAIYDYATGVIQLQDGNFLAVGFENYDAAHVGMRPAWGNGFFMKLNPKGEQIGYSSYVTKINSIMSMFDRGYLITAQDLPDNIYPRPFIHAFIVKYNQYEKFEWLSNGISCRSGSEAWQNHWLSDIFTSAVMTPDRKYVVVGKKEKQFLIMALDTLGNETRSFIFGKGCLNSIIQTHTGNFVVVGNDGIGNAQIYCITNITPVESIKTAHLPLTNALEPNFPNPFNATTTIRFTLWRKDLARLKIFDIRGREITTLLNKELPAGSYQVSFDAGDLPGGVYFYQLQTETSLQTRKLAIVK